MVSPSGEPLSPTQTIYPYTVYYEPQTFFPKITLRNGNEISQTLFILFVIKDITMQAKKSPECFIYSVYP